MEVIPGVRAETPNDFIHRSVTPGSTIYTDGLKGFAGLEAIGFKHVPRSQPQRTELRKGAKSVVPLADRAIGNLKQWLLGTHHGVSRRHLQVYLDEFVLPHNRRKQPMASFQTLLGLRSGREPTGHETINNRGEGSAPQYIVVC
jgi:transposase-like protein